MKDSMKDVIISIKGTQSLPQGESDAVELEIGRAHV